MLTLRTLNIARPDVTDFPASADVNSHYLRERDVVKLVLLSVGSIDSQIPCVNVAAFLTNIVESDVHVVSV